MFGFGWTVDMLEGSKGWAGFTKAKICKWDYSLTHSLNTRSEAEEMLAHLKIAFPKPCLDQGVKEVRTVDLKKVFIISLGKEAAEAAGQTSSKKCTDDSFTTGPTTCPCKYETHGGKNTRHEV